jgi:hypothetical protein
MPLRLTTLPGPLALNIKCLLTLTKGSSLKGELPTLPRKGLAFNHFKFLPNKVAEYSQFCDIKLHSQHVPIFYPYILFFPCQLMLMTDPLFPFPVMGTVHMSNEMTQYKPITMEETGFKAVVRFEDKLMLHDKGICYSIHSELYDSADQLRWHCKSVYLKKCDITKFKNGGERYASAIKEEDVENLEEIKRWHVPRSTAREYAKISGDLNPIHLSQAAAKLFGFHDSIIHGMWTAAVSTAALSKVQEQAGNSGEPKSVLVEFKTPLHLSSDAVLSASSSGFGSASDKKIFEVKVKAPKKEEIVPCLRGRVVF